ncbi:MAG: glycosyltransferase family 2 protein [Gammaproteobacteria bacterium]|nr:glycosyltransferase family 2 protein [Gammaproteobacteria bacterium]
MKMSIITPSFQQGAYILKTLQSVATQYIKSDLEHIVMDGGSTDQTIDILKNATQVMPHLTWTSEPDKGQTHAVNKGILASSGDIIGWLNSDDIYYPDTLQTILDFFKMHPEVDVVYGEADNMDIDDKTIGPYPTEPWNHHRLTETCYISQPTVFFRRHVFNHYGFLNESLQYCMDYEYWLRLSQANAAVAFLPKKLAGSRIHPETKTISARTQADIEANHMVKDKLGWVPNSHIYNYAHGVLKKSPPQKTPSHIFLLKLSYQTLLSSLYWNKKTPSALLSQVGRWLSDAYGAYWHFKRPIVSHVNQGHTQLELSGSMGAYNREHAGRRWWQWVDQQVIYTFTPSGVTSTALHSHFEFKYKLRSAQTLTIDILTTKNNRFKFIIPKTETIVSGFFSKDLEIPLGEIKSVQFCSDCQSTPLSEADKRMASWRIFNFVVSAQYSK